MSALMSFLSLERSGGPVGVTKVLRGAIALDESGLHLSLLRYHGSFEYEAWLFSVLPGRQLENGQAYLSYYSILGVDRDDEQYVA